MTQPIDITNEQRWQLLSLLDRFLPGITVWAYGSRVRWTAKQNSDLDLVVFAKPEYQRQVSALKDALAESDLPFPVDVHVWDEIPSSFHQIIQKEYVVFLDAAASANLNPALVGDWDQVPLLDCTSDRQISYGIVQPGVDYPGGIPIVRVNNLSGGVLETRGAMHVAPEIERPYQRTRLRGGELLLSLVGTTGSVAIVPPDMSGWNVARAIAVIRPKPNIGAE